MNEVYYTEHEGGIWRSMSQDLMLTFDCKFFAAIALRSGDVLYVFDCVLAKMGRNPFRVATAP